MKKFVFVIVMIMGFHEAVCQPNEQPMPIVVGRSDSLTLPHIMRSRFSRTMEKVTSSRLYKMTYIAVPLIVGGIIVQGRDNGYRSIRHDYAPSFKYHYDDYLQYAPMALMVGLKAGGVKGRSSWGRMLTSDAFAAAIMAGIVNTMKYTISVERPDGSNRKSFPSGHTATAFMAATMLHKEYGHRSPWYSIAGYSIATVTGVSRMLNNKHWMSDVMVGAGIGILSVELGYWLADLIFKDKGLNHYDQMAWNYDANYKPSFLGVNLGFNVICGRYYPYPDAKISFMTGVDLSVEGAWFITPYVGVGGKIGVGSYPVKLNNKGINDRLSDMSAYGGVYLSYPLTTRWFSGWKVIGGHKYYKELTADDFRFGDKGGFSFALGHSMMYRANESLDLRFSIDYYMMPPIVRDSEYLHALSFNTSVNISF